MMASLREVGDEWGSCTRKNAGTYPSARIRRFHAVAKVPYSGLVSKVGNTGHSPTANELVEVDERSGEAMMSGGTLCLQGRGYIQAEIHHFL